MGIFFFIEAAPLLDDFEFAGKNETSIDIFNSKLKDAFHQRAYNCWIAAFLYVGLLVFAGVQFMTNMKKSSRTNIPTSITSPFAGVTTEQNGFNSQHGIQFSNDHSDT